MVLLDVVAFHALSHQTAGQRPEYLSDVCMCGNGITSRTCRTVKDLSYGRGVQRYLLEACIVDFCEGSMMGLVKGKDSRITRRMVLM